ncbi:ribonuclease T2-like [[Candida] railenensis]|uniref:Ribonuclease T2-like n=2 Tax=Kurtzmaniella TaxID=549703 RepID=A0A9P0VZE5_9ASCO|nr:ribonuclease T2-like [[Candida] railenensis]
MRVSSSVSGITLISIFCGSAQGVSLDFFNNILKDPVFDFQTDGVAPYDSCPIDIPLSCTNNTPVENSCCFESPGGIMLQTQFWDYYPPIGPNDTFTLHGLWPDNCDGTYEQFCDDSLNVANVTDIIVNEFKDPELYQTMTSIWKNFNGNDESLWMHEFNKHGTCIKTLRPTCYSPSQFSNHENVYDFFNISVNLFRKYPTFEFLASEGIVPSLDKTYTKKEIDDALSKNFGDNKVYFKCNRYQALQEIWYFHEVKGSVKSENFRQIPSFMNSNCPNEGIKFIPKSGFKPPGGGTPNPPGGNPPKPGLGRGYIKLSGKNGCLISNGQWYAFGTCATYQVSKSTFGGYNIKSSKGYCGINADNQLACHSGISPSKFQFQYDKETKEIGYGGKFDWCFDEGNKHGSGRFVQVPIKLGTDCGDVVKLKFQG